MPIIVKGFKLVGSLLFFLCAYWQLNDPDAFWWALVYAVTALIGLISLYRKIAWQVITLPAILITGLGLYYAWIVANQGLHYFEDESGREMMGSLLAGIYLVILAVHAKLTKG